MVTPGKTHFMCFTMCRGLPYFTDRNELKVNSIPCLPYLRIPQRIIPLLPDLSDNIVMGTKQVNMLPIYITIWESHGRPSKRYARSQIPCTGIFLTAMLGMKVSGSSARG